MGKVSGKGLEKEAKRLVSWFAVRLKFHATACRRLANLSVRSSSDATNEKTQCRVETGSHLSLFQGKPGAQASHRPHPCSHPCSDPASEGQNLAQVLSHLLQGILTFCACVIIPSDHLIKGTDPFQGPCCVLKALNIGLMKAFTTTQDGLKEIRFTPLPKTTKKPDKVYEIIVSKTLFIDQQKTVINER
jgi:hypothetical protein